MGKEARKASQMYRREARLVFRGYSIELHKNLEVLNQLLKPRPKFVPKVVWQWLGEFFIDIPKLHEVFKPQLPDLSKIQKPRV
jgi:hypothetical protein